MTDYGLSPDTAGAVAVGLIFGFALAHVHLAALAANVRLYVSSGALWRPVGLHVARLGVMAACFTAAAALDPVALVAMLGGFTLGRARTLRRYR